MKNDLTKCIFSFFVALSILLSIVAMPAMGVKAAATITFTGEELLGKPEDTSITINIVPATTIEYHYQYGLYAGANTWSTDNQTAIGGQPSEVTITGLSPNTQYFYRLQYHAPGDDLDDWVTRDEHSFWTQRAEGENFTFTVTSDSHQNFNAAEQNAMTNILNEHPDFNIDLGDTFLLDSVSSQTTVNTRYLAYREPLYFDKIGSSVPIFLTSGNHENEEGWNFDDTPFSIALGSILARKLYYPTPINDSFYSANTDLLAAIDAGTYGDQYREDYYAWTWGDALFVVIDEFQYTMHLPYPPIAGEGSDDSKTCEYSNDPNCQWNWTLGAQQYEWFKQTLENSHAKYKFVFSHNMLGGVLQAEPGTGAGYVRGGCGGAPYFEWGGKNADGTEGFADRRSAIFGPEAVPIRQLMMENGVSAYFHGHDHQYVYETCDGIVYQEVPSPGMGGSGFGGIYAEGDHGTYETIKILPNSGHLRISVTSSQATVDYISSSSTSGTVNYTYTILPNTSEPKNVLTTAVSPGSGGTVSPAAGVHLYDVGEEVPISAAPSTGYHFVNWTGDVDTVDDVDAASTTITMDDDYSITANFALNTYSLTVNAGAGGTITAPPTSPSIHNYGDIVTITADPDTNYHFVNWTGDVSTVNNANSASTTVTIHGDYTIMANFAEDVYYSLSVGNDGHGSVNLNPTGGNYLSGTTVTLIPVPSEGYHFSSWSGPDAGDIINTAGVYTIVMNENKSITSNFAEDVYYSLTVGNDGHGSVNLNPTGGNYLSGTTVTLTLIPSVGYHFSSWSGANAGDIINDGGVYTIVMNGNKSVTANFAINTYTLTTSNDGHGSVTLTPLGGTYDYGTTVTLTPVPDTNYQFLSWSGTNAADIIYSSGVYTIVMNGNKSVKANFILPTYTLSASSSGHGSVSLAPPGGTYAAGTIVTLTPVPDANFHFVSWSGANAGDIINTGGVYTIVMNGNKSVTANFAIGTYTLTAGNDGHGSVTLAPPGATYDYGTTVTLSPLPSTGYHFSSWSGPNAGDIIDTGGVYTIVMNGNKSVTANFAINTYTLNASSSGHGSVTLAPPGGTYSYGTTVTLTPLPSAGYHFVSWSGANAGDVINNAGVYTIVVNANKSVTANFAINFYYAFLPMVLH